MSTFDERERGFENKFAHDEELQFKTFARRNKLVGQWAASFWANRATMRRHTLWRL